MNVYAVFPTKDDGQHARTVLGAEVDVASAADTPTGFAVVFVLPDMRQGETPLGYEHLVTVVEENHGRVVSLDDRLWGKPMSAGEMLAALEAKEALRTS